MSNILQLNTNPVRFTNEHDDNIFFPVSLQEFTVDYTAENGWVEPATAHDFRAVVREDTGHVMKVHGSDYKLVRNEDLVIGFEDNLRRTSLDFGGMYTRTALLDDGGAFVKSYHFPQETIEVRKGDITELVIKLKGSYNGRWSTSFEQGANRLICTNGMVSFGLFTKAFGRHTKNFEVGNFVDKLTVSAEIFMDNAEIWQHWAKKRVTVGQVDELLKTLELPERFTEDMVQQFRVECAEANHQTVWELFNALTNWSSHGAMRGNAQRAVTTDNREKKVREIINSKAFKALAA